MYLTAFLLWRTPGNRNIQGNGLGLTISKNLALQLGGDIILDSTPNIKTVFSVKLKKMSY